MGNLVPTIGEPTSGGAAAEPFCPCVPATQSQAAHGGAGGTAGCACAGMERVAQTSRSHTLRNTLTAGAFVALLVALVLALWR